MKFAFLFLSEVSRSTLFFLAGNMTSEFEIDKTSANFSIVTII